MATYKKYAELFNQRRGKRDGSEEPKLNTEKDTYIVFLEAQLEKVSNSVLQTNNLTQTTETLQNQVSTIEEKMGSYSKLLKLLQSFADAQVP